MIALLRSSFEKARRSFSQASRGRMEVRDPYRAYPQGFRQRPRRKMKACHDDGRKQADNPARCPDAEDVVWADQKRRRRAANRAHAK